MNASGFTFIHNALEGGYPIVEAIKSVENYVDEMVVVDMSSADGTREVLEKLGVTILEMPWAHISGKVLDNAFELHTQCRNDFIIYFEADEVFDTNLLDRIYKTHKFSGHFNFGCHRIQLEQNFQRCRWYPEPVQRMFKKGTASKRGHTLTTHEEAQIFPVELGMLWDITYCFRDQWIQRLKNNAEYRNEEITYRATPKHFCEGHSVDNIDAFLDEPQWTWTSTPFKIPPILKPLVGRTKYECQL